MTNSSANAHAADSNSTEHRFPWKWYLSDLKSVPQNGKTVFSCFSCGGGSTMGYKLAGYRVIGNCEIDPAMNEVYKVNHHPQYNFQMDIRDFNKREEYPDEIKNLDILDGSPPCSVFSTAGGREKGWGKEKAFREGQEKQRLDDLFFHFIHTAEILQPKVIIAENVKGLLKGKAKGYVNEIVSAFRAAGYKVQLFLMDAQIMGVPQRRERVFFIAHRNDLDFPRLEINVREPIITFGEVRTPHGKPQTAPMNIELMKHRRPGDRDLGDISRRVRGKNTMFTHLLAYDNEVAMTNISGSEGNRFCDGNQYADGDYINTQTFPQDYNFLNQSVQYVCGMSVPPVMMAQIATEVYDQWLKTI